MPPNRHPPEGPKLQPGLLPGLIMTIAFTALILPHLPPYGSHIRPHLLAPMLPIWPSRLLLESAKLQAGPLQGLIMTAAFIARISPHLQYGSLVRPPPPLLVPTLAIRHSGPLLESSGLRSGPRQWPTMTMTIWSRVHIPTYAHPLRMLPVPVSPNQPYPPRNTPVHSPLHPILTIWAQAHARGLFRVLGATRSTTRLQMRKTGKRPWNCESKRNAVFVICSTHATRPRMRTGGEITRPTTNTDKRPGRTRV
jgi:hypothetical protein